MKIKALLFPLIFLIAQVSLAQINPSSPNSQNAAAAVAASGVFISSYQENDREDYYFPPYTNSGGVVFPSQAYSETNFTYWADGKGGNGQSMLDGLLRIYTWPATRFPQPLPSGTGVETYLDYPDIPPYTGACDPPTLAEEHCNFSVGISPFTPINMQRTADTKMTLATGGVAGSKKVNLWVISATATAYSMPWALGGSGEWYTALTGTPIAPQSISILGKALGSDGNLYVILPDNATPNATPVVTGGGDFYSFNITAQKYKLTITANGSPLAADRVRKGANFCVGQYLSFAPVWSPSLPSGTVQDSIQWAFDGTFVNESEQQDPTVAPNGSTIYTDDTDLLKNETTSAWWITGGYSPPTYKGAIGERLTFSNGQVVLDTATGEFTMFRPTISMVGIRPRYFTLTNESFGTYKLGLGDSDNAGAMVYQVNYNSVVPFSGTGRITQLCMLNYSDSPFSSFSDYRLDGTESYEEDSIAPGTAHVSLTFQDGPFNIDTLVNRLQGSFEDYVRFCPDAGSAANNIFVTLGIIDWSMNAAATSPTTISPDDTPDPAGPDGSNQFPFWINIH